MFLQHAQLLCSGGRKLCNDGCAVATCTTLVLTSVGRVGSIEPFVQLLFGGVLVCVSVEKVMQLASNTDQTDPVPHERQ